MTQFDAKKADATLGRTINWRGQSGRNYPLVEQELESFGLQDNGLYLIAKGLDALWIGTATDIIEDQASRARFRDALKRASSVLRLTPPEDDIERMKMVCDIEAGGLAGALTLVS